ncbi:hypothetical protein BBK82_40005 [Lentzea guizhouensis]|uniref:DUF11 domain-containing protein n=1 Tax=Lentzea guizhouensis TaxID=1586287 RepID=A0A1B2HU36_9PSEU|nr:hypothetical protein [Lentzea guizhouensis]ANZ41241.1 hypothetical protein BBK82_40005 [Lentzea guizhouensis]
MRVVVVLSAVVVFLALFTPAPPSRAAEIWHTQFDAAVYGDVAVVGNAVVTCPTPEQAGPDPRYPPQSCVDGQRRSGHGRGVLNNSHRMMWTDVDADPATFNSSRARVTIPDGAEIAYAKLGWAGNARCLRGEEPPGDPRTQPVALVVNGTAGVVDRFTAVLDDPGVIGHTDNQFYSAEADVTARFAAVRGSADLTVGNIWTPQGPDCFGGWSVTVVWRFATAVSAAPAQRRVVVHGGHVRLTTTANTIRTQVSPTRAAGGVTRFGVVGYEGDWGTGGDRLLINGTTLGDRNNFFVSSADGATAPATLNNMSVDARTLSVSSEQLPPGARTAELTLARDEDAFLVQSLAWSFPLPGLTVNVTPGALAAYPGGDVSRTAVVTNVGDAPAAGVVVCGQDAGTLAPRASVTRTCVSKAEQDNFTAVTDASGRSLAGDPLTARASTPVDVLHPALKASTTASPSTVLPGGQLKLTTVVTNSGDAVLSGVSARSTAECGVIPRLDPGASSTVECTVVAGEESGAAVVTVTAADQLGGSVRTEASAKYTVIYPRLTIAAAWSTDRARDGELVTITVTIANPSAMRIDDVRVSGEPVSCRRNIPTLAPGERLTYTCTATAPLNARLIVSSAVTGSAISDSADVRVALVSAPPPPSPSPSPSRPIPIPVPATAGRRAGARRSGAGRGGAADLEAGGRRGGGDHQRGGDGDGGERAVRRQALSSASVPVR